MNLVTQLHAGRRVRFFSEFQGGVEAGRTGGPYVPLTRTVSSSTRRLLKCASEALARTPTHTAS